MVRIGWDGSTDAAGRYSYWVGRTFDRAESTACASENTAARHRLYDESWHHDRTLLELCLTANDELPSECAPPHFRRFLATWTEALA